MTEPLVYRLTHSTGSVELLLSSDRFVVRTKGFVLADKLRTIDIPPSGLRLFAVTPTIELQNIQGTRAMRVVDTSRNAELIFSYDAGAGLQKKRLFVNASDPAFQALVARLTELRPDASLLQLSPQQAYARIGVVSPSRAVWLFVLVLIGIPLSIAIVVAVVSALK